MGEGGGHSISDVGKNIFKILSKENYGNIKINALALCIHSNQEVRPRHDHTSARHCSVVVLIQDFTFKALVYLTHKQTKKFKSEQEQGLFTLSTDPPFCSGVKCFPYNFLFIAPAAALERLIYLITCLFISVVLLQDGGNAA